MATTTSGSESTYLRAALRAGSTARRFLESMEAAAEQLAPERLDALVAEIRRQHAQDLATAREDLDRSPPPPDLVPFALRLSKALQQAERACGLFCSVADAALPQRVPNILAGLHHLAEAQESFYLIRHALPPFADYWHLSGTDVAEPTPPRRDNDSPTGLVHVSSGGHHGGFSLYVPETYDEGRPWPVILALHGGAGNGRDFLWSWVREAKSLGYVLVAPSAVGDTWSWEEELGLRQILSWAGERYHLDRDRILLTGLSDGATFTLLYGLAHQGLYRGLAPLCGVLHPANEAMGNLQRARGVPIYLVHGGLDFLFPVTLARLARDALTQAGAALVYRELEHLSHTYPRSENIRILRWFEALPRD